MLLLFRNGARPSVRTIRSVVLCLVTAGCGGGSQSADQALQKQLDAANIPRTAVCKFAGSVTVDGQPPSLGPNERLVVILYDLKNPPTRDKPPLTTTCDQKGHFEFSTFTRGDGVPPGAYTVLFAQLQAQPGAGMFPPDKLKNLYNDPEKNAEKPEFKLDLSPPGRSDYSFNLDLAGKEAVSTPGSHAVTKITRGG